MTIRDAKELLDAEVVCGEELMDEEVHSACGSDMMSDVLAFVKDQAMLVTGLCNPQVIRTAEMMDMKCVCFVRSKRPTLDMIHLAEDADLVLGSRYKDRRISVVNWDLHRLILSYGANIYTRIVTRLPVSDATGGFKCFRREALQALNLDKMKSDGYCFQIETTFKIWKKGLRVKEIPIVFTDRTRGTSKMSGGIISEAFFLVLKLRLGLA